MSRCIYRVPNALLKYWNQTRYQKYILWIPQPSIPNFLIHRGRIWVDNWTNIKSRILFFAKIWTYQKSNCKRLVDSGLAQLVHACNRCTGYFSGNLASNFDGFVRLKLAFNGWLQVRAGFENRDLAFCQEIQKLCPICNKIELAKPMLLPPAKGSAAARSILPVAGIFHTCPRFCRWQGVARL